MTSEQPMTADEPDVIAASERDTDASDNHTSNPQQHPYLRVFGPDIGVFEHELPRGNTTVGRSERADIRLRNVNVSRYHARITHSDNRYTFEDTGSTRGTEVNRQRVQTHALRHGDTIQIGLYTLQFRTHHAVPGARAAATRAKLLLQSEFCLLPSTMRLRFRTLELAPQNVFRSGDTLRIGHGGLLIPTPTRPDDAACLELHLSWPSDVSKRYLGEIMGAIEEARTHWMCVKLHTVPGSVQQAIVERGQPGPWIDVIAT
jgi:hypothetical protein